MARQQCLDRVGRDGDGAANAVEKMRERESDIEWRLGGPPPSRAVIAFGFACSRAISSTSPLSKSAIGGRHSPCAAPSRAAALHAMAFARRCRLPRRQ
ncbi:hypothetical protein [Oryza sativa Japonica Group]|uniref:Uncharacterized protein n=2 Tax=Oryza sativa subsp. japonica TaxID=39947 RepID=Q5QL99_ORYSJ|nr:hypothetical protein [Oryza sativa Japonica Group]BAD73802.1 hypothetical protein [Oryza sativa Japonica Group]